ncbi:hypothetical protein [uncultured Novosphingobium sp.]|uniref:hypothetical protein n=1 Tax=uncultured Novosphingobium sp. TaxID=292277 RepID=UPI00374A46E7
MTDNPLVEAVGEAIFNVDVGNTSSDDERHYHVTLYNHQTKEDEVIATYDYSYGVANSLELHVKHKKEQRALAALRAIEDAGYEIVAKAGKTAQ